jgi:hypothetical protein
MRAKQPVGNLHHGAVAAIDGHTSTPDSAAARAGARASPAVVIETSQSRPAGANAALSRLKTGWSAPRCGIDDHMNGLEASHWVFLTGARDRAALY